MRRGRGVGVGRSGPKFTKKAEEIKAVSLQSAIETVKKLEVKLAEFAKKHKKEIQKDPAFRQKFLQMCAPLGVDPLSSEKGFWQSWLGIGEFYYELAVKVAEVCLASKSRNGGIISVQEVKRILRARKTKFQFGEESSSSSSSTGRKDHRRQQQQQQQGNKYSTDDIIMAISKLSKLGSGFRTVQVGKSTMIVSVPMELDRDHMEVMEVAQDPSNEESGRVTMEELRKVTGWTHDRSKRALDLLLTSGMAWLDIHKGKESYWVPSIWKEGTDGDADEDEDL